MVVTSFHMRMADSRQLGVRRHLDGILAKKNWSGGVGFEQPREWNCARCMGHGRPLDRFSLDEKRMRPLRGYLVVRDFEGAR